MQTRRNLIWIIVDSVRTYRTHADDRDRLDVMDEFALESIEFLNAYASAPSSILSGAAMFTGMPSCFISRHFNDWQFDPEVVVSLQDVLAENGYANYAIHNSKEDREVMRDLIHPIPREYFPRGISHGKWWTNRQVTLILENVLKLGVKQPAVFMLWYDCRKDALTSDMVKQALQLFKEYGLYDNSVIIMNSDHGYPDPRTELIDPKWQRKANVFNIQTAMRKVRHDLVVTDDNIRVPLLVKYPGCCPHQVNDSVGLVDLFPTILHLLDINCNDPRMKYVQGFDLYELLEGGQAPWNDRIIRIDTRLTLAPGRVTALRSKKYKYVYYHDEKIESLFDMGHDPWELCDLLENASPEVAALRESFQEELVQLEDDLNRFHIDELRTTFDKSVRRMKTARFNRMVFLSIAPTVFLDLITESFRATFPAISIDILTSKHHPLGTEIEALFDRVIIVEKVEPGIVRKALKEQKLSRYDVALVITEKSGIGFDNPIAHKVAKVLGRKVLLVDYNMKFYSRFLARWVWPLRKYRRNWEFYKHEPLLVLWDVMKIAKRGILHYLLKRQTEAPDMEKVRLMRARALKAQKEASLTARPGIE